MRKYLWPILVIALALSAAGAWVLFPKARTTARSAVSSFCSSFSEQARHAWSRLFPPKGEAVVPDALAGKLREFIPDVGEQKE